MAAPNGLGLDAMGGQAAQFGLINSFRTGNVVLDMLVCMLIPMLFGGIGSVLQTVRPVYALQEAWRKFSSRHSVRRVITSEKRVNCWGYAFSDATSDNKLQRAIMLYISKEVKPKHKSATLTLTELPKKLQGKKEEE